MEKNPFLKRKSTTAVFALIAFLGGFLFLNHSLTGNVIINESRYLDLVSLVGLGLIACSLTLALYSVKRKKK